MLRTSYYYYLRRVPQGTHCFGNLNLDFQTCFFFIRESPTVVGLFNFTIIIIIIIIANSSGNIICRSFISHSLHVAENLNRFGIW